MNRSPEFSKHVAAPSAREGGISAAHDLSGKHTRRESRPNVAEATAIELRGVRVHNLKNLDLDIPLNQLVVISGVSGSGKSSLAFDTLFAEGQRRYIESFSIASRRYLERVERPDADRLAHVPVAIAIRTDAARGQYSDARSTVATVAELLDGMRILFSRVGKIVCPGCGRKITVHSAADVVRESARLSVGARFQIAFAVDEHSDADPVATWLARGFSHAIWNGAAQNLSAKPEWSASGEAWIVTDRLVSGKATPERILESAEVAFREGKGHCLLLIAEDDLPRRSLKNGTQRTAEPEETNPNQCDDDTLRGNIDRESTLFGCETENISIDGRNWRMTHFSRRLECISCKRDFLPLEPQLFSHVSSGACLNCRGTGRGLDDQPCPTCLGSRYREEARAVLVANRSIADLCRMTPSSALTFMRELKGVLAPDELQQTELIRGDIERRMAAVCDLGLNYLALDRSVETLSGGESRRLMLAAVIGSGITGTMVVVDEPSAGLAEIELPRVVTALRRVQSLRNTVIAVDHSPFVIAAADHVIEVRHGAGKLGGNIVYQGSADSRLSAFDGELEPTRSDVAKVTLSGETKRLRLSNVCHHNLHEFEAEFPLGQLCVVSGTSGSGKTTLVTQVLYPAVCDRLGVPCEVRHRGTCELSGVDGLVDVVLVDQSPLTKTSRSNPATWLEVFDEIRQTFAATADAKLKGFTSRQFSFNSSSGGRCRSCLGTGLLKQDMQFLPDVTMSCPECSGTRYRPEILEVKYRGRSIADVLAMSVSEAASFFRSQPRLQNRFQMLKQIGLDYLVLGQPSETLSGGEAQRLKIAARLATPSNGGCLMICDEPTTGLHPSDVRRLVTCFRELLANGHSLVLADNSPELLAAADVVIELTTTNN